MQAFFHLATEISGLTPLNKQQWEIKKMSNTEHLMWSFEGEKSQELEARGKKCRTPNTEC